MCTFPLISFRELSASMISAFSSRSCRPSVVWPETTSSAAALLTMQTAGWPWWTLLSVRLERCCYWMFSCFYVSFMAESTVIPGQLQRLRIQRGPLCFAQFYHEFVSSRFTSDPGKITVFYLPSEKSVIQANARVCSIEDIKSWWRIKGHRWWGEHLNLSLSVSGACCCSVYLLCGPAEGW